ncbi:MAG: hypothetical protein WAW60_01315 [Candidatus Saccharimonadales bacterium]
MNSSSKILTFHIVYDNIQYRTHRPSVPTSEGNGMSIFIIGLVMGQVISIFSLALTRQGENALESIGMNCIFWSAVYGILVVATAAYSSANDTSTAAPLLSFVLVLVNLTLAYLIHRHLEQLVRKPR